MIEGYYAVNVYDIAGQTTFLASMWKEYALSDSRYMTVDSCVWMIESITAVRPPFNPQLIYSLDGVPCAFIQLT